MFPPKQQSQFTKLIRYGQVVNTERRNMTTTTLTTAADISVVLSGGSNNMIPNASLGGNPSVTPIVTNVLDNLFDDISSDQNNAGFTDYRCIYFFNDGDTTIYSVNTYILSEQDGGAVMKIGVIEFDEFQRIAMVGLPTGGSAVLSYDGFNVTFDYDPSISVMATSLQNALNSLVDSNNVPVLQDVSITAQPIQSTILFDIVFAGRDGSRSHPTIHVVSNSFTPSVTMSITKVQSGCPINSIASEINNPTTPPGGVAFVPVSTQISLPLLRTGDGFPLWVQRTVAPNTAAKANDGFTLRFQAESLAPSGS
jgi:hypothetical protein